MPADFLCLMAGGPDGAWPRPLHWVCLAGRPPDARIRAPSVACSRSGFCTHRPLLILPKGVSYALRFAHSPGSRSSSRRLGAVCACAAQHWQLRALLIHPVGVCSHRPRALLVQRSGFCTHRPVLIHPKGVSYALRFAHSPGSRGSRVRVVVRFGSRPVCSRRMRIVAPGFAHSTVGVCTHRPLLIHPKGVSYALRLAHSPGSRGFVRIGSGALYNTSFDRRVSLTPGFACSRSGFVRIDLCSFTRKGVRTHCALLIHPVAEVLRIGPWCFV